MKRFGVILSNFIIVIVSIAIGLVFCEIALRYEFVLPNILKGHNNEIDFHGSAVGYTAMAEVAIQYANKTFIR